MATTYHLLVTLPTDAEGPYVLAALVDQGFTVGPLGDRLYTRTHNQPGVLMALAAEHKDNHQSYSDQTRFMNTILDRLNDAARLASAAMTSGQSRWVLRGPSPEVANRPPRTRQGAKETATAYTKLTEND